MNSVPGQFGLFCAPVTPRSQQQCFIKYFQHSESLESKREGDLFSSTQRTSATSKSFIARNEIREKGNKVSISWGGETCEEAWKAKWQRKELYLK